MKPHNSVKCNKCQLHFIARIIQIYVKQLINMFHHNNSINCIMPTCHIPTPAHHTAIILYFLAIKIALHEINQLKLRASQLVRLIQFFT